MKNYTSVFILLRIGISSVFLYAAIASTINSDNWIGYLPQYLKSIFPVDILLKCFSVYELVLGIWLLTGWKTFYAAVLSSITLFGIIITNLEIFDVTFRDVSILFSAIALAIGSRE